MRIFFKSCWEALFPSCSDRDLDWQAHRRREGCWAPCVRERAAGSSQTHSQPACDSHGPPRTAELAGHSETPGNPPTPHYPESKVEKLTCLRCQVSQLPPLQPFCVISGGPCTVSSPGWCLLPSSRYPRTSPCPGQPIRNGTWAQRLQEVNLRHPVQKIRLLQIQQLQ